MGTAASTKRKRDEEIFSPRLKMFKKGEKVILDSEPLKDIGLGTVRYRHDTPTNETTGESLDLQKGYFYHPTIEDYSEVSNIEKENVCKFVRVEKPSNKSHNKELQYVTGIGFDGNQQILPPTLHDKSKKFGHKYYKISLTEQNENVLAPTDNNSSSYVYTLNTGSTIRDLKSSISEREVCPVGIIHIKDVEELSDKLALVEFFKCENEEQDLQVKVLTVN